MPPKKIALISDAWDPQVNGVVTTFKNIIPLLNKKNYVNIEFSTLKFFNIIQSDAIKRISIFSNKSSRQVALEISDNQITITTEDPENITSGNIVNIEGMQDITNNVINIHKNEKGYSSIKIL